MLCARKVGDLTKKFSNLPESYIKRSMDQVGHITDRAKMKTFVITTCTSKSERNVILINACLVGLLENTK